MSDWQPRAGDELVSCGHVKTTTPGHRFYVFRVPSSGVVGILCGRCMVDPYESIRRGGRLEEWPEGFMVRGVKADG